MRNRIIFFLMIGLFICLSACKTQRHRPKHKPERKKKCDCPHFSQTDSVHQSTYLTAFYAEENP